MDVQVQPDDRPVQFVIPDELKNDQRLKAAREKAAFLNSVRAEVRTGGEKKLSGKRETTPSGEEGEGGATGKTSSLVR
jgi:hypothetical protein